MLIKYKISGEGFRNFGIQKKNFELFSLRNIFENMFSFKFWLNSLKQYYKRTRIKFNGGFRKEL